MIPWCLVITCKLHLLNYHVWRAKWQCCHDPKLNIKHPSWTHEWNWKVHLHQIHTTSKSPSTHIYGESVYTLAIWWNIYFRGKKTGRVCLICWDPKLLGDASKVHTSAHPIFVTWPHINPENSCVAKKKKSISTQTQLVINRYTAATSN